MKKLKIFIFVLMFYFNNVYSSTKILDRCVAIVNNNIILESDLNDILIMNKNKIKIMDKNFQEYSKIKNQILNKLIIENILLQLIKNYNLSITDKQLDSMIKNIINQNGINLEKQKQILKNKDINYNLYKDNIKKNILINKLFHNEIDNKILILPQELNSVIIQLLNQKQNKTEFNFNSIFIPIYKYYTKTKISKIEFMTQNLIEKIKINNNFEKLKKLNFYKIKTLKNNIIGWKSIDKLPKYFSKYLINIKKGDIIGPIRSENGFYIIKVNDIRTKKQKISDCKVHLRHILLHTSKIKTDQKIYDILENIYKKIKSKKISFQEAAKKLSEDVISAKNGGDLGWISISSLNSELKNKLIQLDKEEITTPIRSSSGWHLIQFVDSNQDNINYNINIDQAYQLIFNRKFSDKIKLWMQKQIESSYIKIIKDN